VAKKTDTRASDKATLVIAIAVYLALALGFSYAAAKAIQSLF